MDIRISMQYAWTNLSVAFIELPWRPTSANFFFLLHPDIQFKL